MNHHDIPEQHEAAEPGEAHEPLLDAEDAKDQAGEDEAIEAHDGPRTQGEKIAEDMRRLAKEGAFAAAGFAGFVSEKAKEFYDEQRTQYRQAHPDADTEPGAKEFLGQMREKLHEFVDGLTKAWQDMAERGRGQGDGLDPDSTDQDEGSPDSAEADPDVFAADTAGVGASFGGLPDESAVGDVPPADAVVVEEVVPEGSEGDAAWPGEERTEDL